MKRPLFAILLIAVAVLVAGCPKSQECRYWNKVACNSPGGGHLR